MRRKKMESVELLRIIDELAKIKTQLDDFKTPNIVSLPSRSVELNELFSALSKAQSEMKIAGTTSENPYFKSSYADLAEIVKASRPALTKNGLSVLQQIIPNDDGQNLLITILGHSSGQWIETRMRILPAKPDIQSLGSYITYLRRYSYASIIGVVASGEDDDGEIAVLPHRESAAKGTALNTKYNPKEQSYESITKEQLQELHYELEEFPDIAEMILEGMKIQNLSDLPKSKFLVSVNRIREIKKIRKGDK